FKSHFFSLNGNNLHYLDEGDGPVVILVHGNPSWSFLYRNLIKTLKSGFRVIVPDHMGSGLSERPYHYPYTLSSHIENLNNLTSHLRLKSYSLVVHDWGGPIGMGHALQNLSALESLVILNTAAFFDEKLPKRIRLCRTPLVGEWFMRSPMGFAYLASKMAVNRPLSASASKGYLYPYNNYKNRIGNARFVQDIPLNKNNSSYSQMLKIQNNLGKLTCPKLIAWGGGDFCFNRRFYDRFLKIYPDARHVYLPRAGHYLLEDAGEDVIPMIESFLRNSL
ncbi:MAG: alpha/beta fold hydrolase, partial [Halobacteriovoraceae bacterium]|nr:alpha/beta fold hydrolase [Halobacteriovoraceae bacterium]